MEGISSELISAKTLSALLDVPEATIRKWVLKKKIRYRKIGKLVRFDVKEIRSWCNANIVNPIAEEIINDKEIQK